MAATARINVGRPRRCVHNAARALPCGDGRDRARMRLPRQRAEGADLRVMGSCSARRYRPVRHPDLYGDSGQSRNPRGVWWKPPGISAASSARRCGVLRSARTTRSAPITNPPRPLTTVPFMWRLTTAACLSPKQAARLATCSSTAACLSRRWRYRERRFSHHKRRGGAVFRSSIFPADRRFAFCIARDGMGSSISKWPSSIRANAGSRCAIESACLPSVRSRGISSLALIPHLLRTPSRRSMFTSY